jgi:hypothetical protein
MDLIPNFIRKMKGRCSLDSRMLWNEAAIRIEVNRSSCVYSQCAKHIAVGPCAKGHYIHTKPTLDPESFFFFFFFYFYMCGLHHILKS